MPLWSVELAKSNYFRSFLRMGPNYVASENCFPDSMLRGHKVLHRDYKIPMQQGYIEYIVVARFIGQFLFCLINQATTFLDECRRPLKVVDRERDKKYLCL